jgi:2,3-bisphosphoglycerate-independent phosphoglycerate mutase
MSAQAVCEESCKAILAKDYAFLVVNFANADMVGHTGSLEAAVKAVEAVDACVGQIMKAVDAVGGCALITADHGNADQMYSPDAKVAHTQHTLNRVEFLLCGKGCEAIELRPEGRLADIAPTVVDLLGLIQPKAMTGQSLLGR